MKEKSKVLTFFLAFCPGVAHMYLGLMKRGVELMGLFFLAIYTSSSFRMSFLGIFIPIIWFYSFFDALNLVNEEDEYVEDKGIIDVLWFNGEKAAISNKVIAYVFIILGVLMLINNVLFPIIEQYIGYGIVDTIRSIVPAAVLVGFGILLLRGGKKFEYDNAYEGNNTEELENFESNNYDETERFETSRELEQTAEHFDVVSGKYEDTNNELPQNQIAKRDDKE